MIRSFRCDKTEALSKGNPVKQFVNFANVARRKLRQLEIANRLDDLRVCPPAIVLKRSGGIVLDSTAFALTTSGAFAFAGRIPVLKTLKSLITIEESI
jgi:hypothetical protein